MATAQNTTIINFKTDFSDQKGLIGKLSIEERNAYDFYYCWSVFSKNNTALVTKCLSLSKRTIPGDVKQLDFVINHAIEGINRHRIGRQKVFKVTQWKVKQ